jgi:hypothetical protein
MMNFRMNFRSMSRRSRVAIFLLSMGCGDRPIGSLESPDASTDHSVSDLEPRDAFADSRQPDAGPASTPPDVIPDAPEPNRAPDTSHDLLQVDEPTWNLGPDTPTLDLPATDGALAPSHDSAMETQSVEVPSSRRWEPTPGKAGERITYITHSTSYYWVGFTDGEVFSAPRDDRNPPYWTRMDGNDRVGLPVPRLPKQRIAALVPVPKNYEGAMWIAFSDIANDRAGHKVWLTATGGRTWTEMGNSPYDNVWSLSSNPLIGDTNKAVLCLVTEPAVVGTVVRGDLRRSIDGGAQWEWPTGPDEHDLETMNGTNISAIGFDVDSDAIWTGHQDGSIWVSRDATLSATDRKWERRDDGDRDAGNVMPARTVNHLSVVIANTQEYVAAAFISTQSDGVWLSDDGGDSWRNVHGKEWPASMVVYSVTINPAYPSTLYAFTSEGTFYSDNLGESWR